MEGYHEAKPLIGGTYHKSVLVKEAGDILNIKKNNRYLDCTLGDGGHSLEILKLGGRVVGIDVDPQALERARKRLQGAGYSGQFVLIRGNFRDLKNLILQPASPASRLGGSKRGEQTDTRGLKFAGAIFDLGVSSLQLETPQRGFSFGKEGPLDMRMDPALQVKALDLINALNEGELSELFFKLGNEKHSRKLAKALVGARQVRGIKSTRDLAYLVEKTLGKYGKIHPATKVFQALRIAVNDELNALKEGLAQVKEVVEKNGHMVVISFHSLEDRIVKNIFFSWQDQGLGQVLTKKPVTPSEKELKVNPSSRSAKMRVFKVL